MELFDKPNHPQDEDGIQSAFNLFSRKSVEEIIKESSNIYSPLAEYEYAQTYFEKLRILKGFYLHNHDAIIAEAKKCKNRFFIAYPIDWMCLFTPIEKTAWCTIRSKGRIVLYPQYPVLNFHIDFANPYLKIGLELDGKAFHDKAKDTIRDQWLADEGWTIIRITGSEMEKTYFKDFTDCYEEYMSEDETRHHVNKWILGTGDGVIEAIKRVYFEPPPLEGVKDWWFYEVCKQSINEHRLVKNYLNPITKEYEALY